MASLRTTAATRLLRSAAPSGAGLPRAARRFESSLTTSGPPPPAAPARQHDAPEFATTPDKAASSFSPVPRKVQDGSEEGILSATLISGAPIELQGRTVRIYREAKPATQSGEWKGSKWRLDWDVLPKGHRWENPLMGWQSSADFVQGTRIFFESKEDAIAFAEKQGYEYYVQEPQSRKFAPKAYANNFLYSAKKLKTIRTK